MPARPDGIGLADLQHSFAGAVLRARLSVPDGVRREVQPTRERRFRVYRNNVKASLVAALAARFPVVGRLVGEEFFTAMALVFVERHPPRSPVLAEYGAVDISRLVELPPEVLGSVRLGLHPATAVVPSRWPIVSIWTTNTHDETPRAPAADWAGETALVTRLHLDVLVHRLPPGADLLVAELARGIALGAAADAASRAHASFDLATSLSTLFGAGAVTTLSQGSSS